LMSDDVARPWVRIVGLSLIVLLGVIAVLEMVTRLSGAADFPIYEVGSPTGYVVAPHQAGRFLDRNDWYFNNKSMPIQQDWAVVHPNVLLVGNSIIMGGDPFRQAEKLTSQLEKRLGPRPVVWPVAIGGWSQPNEVAYLNAHPEIVASTDYLAWEYMAGGLSRPTPWVGPYVFPTHRPIYATGYIFRRYVLPRLMNTHDPSGIPVTGALNVANLQSFNAMAARIVHSANCRPAGFIWLYPTELEFNAARNGADWLAERSQVTAIARANGLNVIDIAREPSWSVAFYRPDGIHPTAQGAAALAVILAREISGDMAKRHMCEQAIVARR